MLRSSLLRYYGNGISQLSTFIFFHVTADFLPPASISYKVDNSDSNTLITDADPAKDLFLNGPPSAATSPAPFAITLEDMCIQTASDHHSMQCYVLAQ